MSLATLLPLALKISIAFYVFGLGLRTDLSEVTHLVRTLRLLVRSMLSLFVIMPLFAVALALWFDLRPPVKAALVALAVSPIPPFLPTKEIKAGGKHDYAMSLLITASVFATFLIPVTMKLLGSTLHLPLQMSPEAVAILVLKTLLVPLGLGIAFRMVARSLAGRFASPVANISMALLILGVVPVLVTSRHAFVSLIGDGTLLSFAAFTLAGLGIGHLLGGPEHEHRSVLALSTASRHPGVAAAIAQANFPQQRLALAAILLFLLVNIVVSAPYVGWSKKGAKRFSEDSDRLAA